MLLRTPAATFLFDCGFTAGAEVWKYATDPNEIDLIYISHAHADHYFGLPGLLGRMWEEGRTKPLTVLTQPFVWESIEQALTLGYRSLRKRFQYPLQFVEAVDSVAFADASFRFAQTRHSSPNLAVRVEADDKVFCYSGDGAVTRESCLLYRDADVLVHEAFGFERSDVHATVDDVLQAASGASVRRVALVHIARGVRRERTHLMRALLMSPVRCLVPEPGNVISVALPPPSG